MKKQHYLAIIIALALALVLWLGFDRKTPDQKTSIAQREMVKEVLNIDNLIRERKKELSREELTTVNILEGLAIDSTKKEEIKELSGKWFALGYPEIAGHYAKNIAELERTDHAWGIAATTYVYGVRKYEDVNLHTYCKENAERAFENAISLNPDEISHAVNLAVLRSEFPDPQNPMMGVQMLLDLNKKHPDNITILLTLARFGMQTGQYDRVIDRANKVLEQDSENTSAKCFLAKAYQALGQESLAAEYADFCK